MDRAHFKSIYLRDPDGHILELAVGPGVKRVSAAAGLLVPAAYPLSSVRLPDSAGTRSAETGVPRTPAPPCRGAFFAVKTAASARRWRSVSVPTCLFSGTPRDTSNRLQRVRPQRFWLISRSLIDMLCACQGQ